MLLLHQLVRDTVEEILWLQEVFRQVHDLRLKDLLAPDLSEGGTEPQLVPVDLIVHVPIDHVREGCGCIVQLAHQVHALDVQILLPLDGFLVRYQLFVPSPLQHLVDVVINR